MYQKSWRASKTLICRMLSKSKQGGSGGKTCIHTNYDQCMYGAMVDAMHNKTASENGCTVPWVLMEDGSGAQKICKKPENINATFLEYGHRVTNQLDDCPVPCETLMVTVGAKNYEVV